MVASTSAAVGAEQPLHQKSAGREPGRASPRWVPASLLALGLIPMLAAAARLVQVTGGPELIPKDARFAASPIPIAVHAASVITYTVLGAWQFSAALRRRRPGWHRGAGRVLVGFGLAVALSGLWMALFYPRKAGTGELLYVVRLLVSIGMASCIVLGLAAIRRRDVGTHRAWMTRAYALALGAGTQALTVGFGNALFGVGVLRTDLMMTAGWVINLAAAGYLLRRRGPRRRAAALLVG